jgi:hypothetical protein
MPREISRIIFSGDSFRSDDGNADQIANVIWLKAKVGDLFTDLTGLASEIRLPLLGQTVAEFLELQGCALEPNLDTWASLFWDSASVDLVERIAEECRGALLVTIEMPPILEDALNRAGIPWIDIGISPLRFLPDWAFHLKTSAHFHIDAVRDLLLTPPEIEQYAAHVRNWYDPADIVEPTIVFFGQTLRDRTLIRHGRFAGKEDVLSGLAGLQDKDRPLLLKPHPWQAESNVIQALIETGGEITTANTYALLASPQVEVVTLSSSVGREARFFGRQVTTITPSVQDWAFSGVDVLRHALSPRFWGALFASADIPVGAAMEREIDWLPNHLRGDIPQQGLDSIVWENYQ